MNTTISVLICVSIIVFVICLFGYFYDEEPRIKGGCNCYSGGTRNRLDLGKVQIVNYYGLLPRKYIQQDEKREEYYEVEKGALTEKRKKKYEKLKCEKCGNECFFEVSDCLVGRNWNDKEESE